MRGARHRPLRCSSAASRSRREATTSGAGRLRGCADARTRDGRHARRRAPEIVTLGMARGSTAPVDQIERAAREPAAARLLARMAVVDDRDPRARPREPIRRPRAAGPAPTIPIVRPSSPRTCRSTLTLEPLEPSNPCEPLDPLEPLEPQGSIVRYPMSHPLVLGLYSTPSAAAAGARAAARARRRAQSDLGRVPQSRRGGRAGGADGRVARRRHRGLAPGRPPRGARWSGARRHRARHARHRPDRRRGADVGGSRRGGGPRGRRLASVLAAPACPRREPTPSSARSSGERPARRACHERRRAGNRRGVDRDRRGQRRDRELGG